MRTCYPCHHYISMGHLLITLLFPALVVAESFEGRVVSITDGDTIRVMREGVSVPVRLFGIDSPGKKQPFSQVAKKITSDLAFSKTVTVEIKTTDRWKRLVAEIVLPDGRILNHEILKAGGAWWFRQYCKDPEYERLEAAARAAKVGIWRDPKPVEPWEWRKGQR